MTKDEIKQIVHDTVRETLKPLGVDIDDASSLREFNSDLGYLRRTRRGSEEVTRWTKRGLVGAGIAGLLVLLWEGFKQAMKSGPSP